MRFINFLDKYEKDSVSDVIKAMNDDTRNLKTIIKEAFCGEFVGKTEAMIRIRSEFTDDNMAPDSINVNYVKENVNDICRKIDNLSEGNIKIIINNDVNKDEEEIVKPFLPMPPMPTSLPSPLTGPGPLVDITPSPTPDAAIVVTDKPDKKDEEYDGTQTDMVCDKCKKKYKGVSTDTSCPDCADETNEGCGEKHNEAVELKMDGNGYKMKMGDVPNRPKMYTDEEDMGMAGDEEYLDEIDDDITDDESEIVDELEDELDDDRLSWKDIVNRLDAIDDGIQTLIDVDGDGDADIDIEEVDDEEIIDDVEEEIRNKPRDKPRIDKFESIKKDTNIISENTKKSVIGAEKDKDAILEGKTELFKYANRCM